MTVVKTTGNILTLAKNLIKDIGGGAKNITKEQIKNAPVPVRYKKLLQGVTDGEKKIAPSAIAGRAMALQEAKTLGAYVSGDAIINQLFRVINGNPNRTPQQKITDAKKTKSKDLVAQKMQLVKNKRANVPDFVKVGGGTSPKSYTIKKGDTLSQISKTTKIPVTRLKSLNNIKDANKIKAGKKLQLN
jgi:LysM repeat protein|tara:strand:+ start:52 stop:615 length:564 start_codon:yes stop_codon:yes gene_type:complete